MNNKGFTLIEMIVAVAVFSLVIGASTGLFISSLRAQRQNLATREVLDQTSYIMEYMSRALRMAKKDITGTCTGTAKSNYQFESQCIKFINYKDECQHFCLVGSRLKNKEGNYLTSANLNIKSFNVNLVGQGQIDTLQPKITIFLDIEGKEQSNIKIQTTISQRNLDVRQ